MQPETSLTFGTIDTLRALVPTCRQLASPTGRHRVPRAVRNALADLTGDVEFLRNRMADRDHPDLQAIDDALAFAWCPPWPEVK